MSDKEIIAKLKGKLSVKNELISTLKTHISYLQDENGKQWNELCDLRSDRQDFYWKIKYKAFNKDKTLKSDGIKEGIEKSSRSMIRELKRYLFHPDSFELIAIEKIALD